MNVKVVVKVMNFHALLRVENSMNRAEAYRNLETQIYDMLTYICSNKNLILDKKILKPNPSMPELSIYFGSDYGFCGAINSQVSNEALKDESSYKIVVGKKVSSLPQNILLKVSREDFEKNYHQVSSIIREAIEQMHYSKINLVYFHFNNTSSIELKKKCIFPVELDRKDSLYSKEDFSIEGDIGAIMSQLIHEFVNYEVKIAAVNSYASENILRQNATTESIKKIEEKEVEADLFDKKEQNKKKVKKIIESYTSKRGKMTHE